MTGQIREELRTQLEEENKRSLEIMTMALKEAIKKELSHKGSPEEEHAKPTWRAPPPRGQQWWKSKNHVAGNSWGRESKNHAQKEEEHQLRSRKEKEDKQSKCGRNLYYFFLKIGRDI